MELIEIKENQKKIWNEFIAENCSESFLQSWEWGEFQKSLGRRAWKIGVIGNNLSGEDGTNKLQITNYKLQTNPRSQINSKFKIQNSKLLATALVVKHNLPFGKSYLYCPRGPVMEKRKTKNEKRKIMGLLFSEIKKIAEKEKSLFLRIDPPASWNLELGTWNLEYNWILKKSLSEIQPKDTLILDLTKSEEELLGEMKQKTRYNIKLAERKKLEIRNWEIGKLGNWENLKKDFEKFWELMKETSRRNGFRSHGRDYYWKMLENLDCCNKENENCHSEFISESIGDKDLSCFKFVEQNMERIKDAGGYKQKIPELNSEQALKQVQDDKCNCKNKLQAKLYLAEYDNKIIAANIVLYFGDLAVYLHGASSGEYRNTMAPYLLQWRQILDAKKIGCGTYDFWGIASELKVKSSKSKVNSKFQIPNSKFNNWSGITRFKKGFGGFEKNYIGAYDLAFDNIGYAIYGFLKKIKKINLISNYANLLK